ncbi:MULTISPECIES: OmpA family protein [Photobacterium]|uniref:OmpA family protein n=1 Tax=Photobacterium TaxID=657 RepID=UPI001E37F523|nr:MULTISPECIES: OmpA family protein [Photobacterium]MCD9477013.1 OmpA family protein [Photobacterium phosphoreum]MCD9486596.1 OmpA family protein [Photobacterium iliopiscarium]MCD9508529.1 OmpA family protein [Photobacterium phosphoreum]MCD9529080.1 OmpA family protein [Photobacterium carnosum]MCD9539160.1 OmpA family protein [Photobacterium carnosum]
MKKTFLVLPLALLVSGVANAATDNPFYAGARLGNSFYDIKDSTNSINLDDKNLSGGVFAGYQITPWFAAEVGYTNLGSASVTNGQGKFTAQGADLVGKYSYAINDKFDVFAKLGVFYYDWNAKNGAQSDDKGWASTAGVGAEYYINNNVSTRVEYQYYKDVGGADIQFAGVSLAYHWGAPAPVVAPEVVYVDQVSVATIDELKLTVPFAFDSSKITTGDAAQLAPFEARLDQYPDATITVVGHTDSTGPEAYNQKLSQQRAEAVAQALRTHLNVGSDRILSEGRGELDPIAPNDTTKGRAENRRVDIIAPELNIETVTQVVAK